MASACTDSKNSKSCVQKRMVGRFLDFTDRRTIRPTWYVASVIKRGSVRKGSKVACEELKELEVMCGSACGGERTLVSFSKRRLYLHRFEKRITSCRSVDDGVGMMEVTWTKTLWRPSGSAHA